MKPAPKFRDMRPIGDVPRVPNVRIELDGEPVPVEEQSGLIPLMVGIVLGTVLATGAWFLVGWLR